MKERDESRKASVGSRAVSILLPVLSCGFLILSLFLNNLLTYNRTVKSIAYVLCFDFVFLFCFELFKEKLSINGASYCMLVAGPALCFFTLYTKSVLLTVIMGLIFITLLSVTVDFTFGLILILGLTGYISLFIPSFLGSTSIYLIYLVLICVLSRSIKSVRSMIYSMGAAVAFFIVLAIIGSEFVLSEALNSDNLIIMAMTLAVLTAVYFIRKYLIESDEKASAGPVPETSEEKQTLPVGTSNSKLNAELRKLRYDFDRKNDENDKLHTEVNKLKEEISKLNAMKNSVTVQAPAKPEKKLYGTASVEDIISADFPYLTKLKSESLRLYEHCKEVSKVSGEASELIGCDSQIASALGLYHEAARYLGDGWARILSTDYCVPSFVIKLVEQIKRKDNTTPFPREAGIVSLTDDIINTINYLKNNNTEGITMDRIVNNTIRVRKEQNFLRLAGFSNEEVQLLRLYYIDLGGSNDTDD